MVAEEIKKIIESSLEDLKKEGSIKINKLTEIKLEHPAEMDLGDYATNIALVIAKKENKTPSEVAGLIIGKLPARHSLGEGGKIENCNLLDSIQEVGGFINFFISKEYLAKELLNILKNKGKYGSGETKDGLFGKKKRIVIDYSGPNIAKPFGIGHLRSTIIGQAIYNIYNFLGWKTTGVNHLGDWGTPHGAIIYQIKERKLHPKADRPLAEKEKEKILDNLTVAELEGLYVDFHKETKDNPEMKEKARDWFRKLEEGDKEARNIWEHTREVSLKEFRRIYDLLEVKIDNITGESFYEDMLEDVVKECRDKKIAKESEGAWIVDFAKYPKLNFGRKKNLILDETLPPAMLLKSDGATTYFTRDLTVLKYRLAEFGPKVLVYETGTEQALHFKQVFEAARMLRWIKDEKLVHVAHGLYRREHGKFSTRKGDTIHLEDILEESIERAKNIIDESETVRPACHAGAGVAGRGLSESERDEVAKAVGIGGVKYNDLSHNPTGDIIFDWDKILNLKGNSAPYIQYTYARCKSILAKAGPGPAFAADVRGRTPKGGTTPATFTEEELDILRFIYRFQEVVRESAEKFSPNLITNFVFDLSQKFNLFYSAYSVLNAENEETKKFRLLLTAAVAQVIHNALTLLGIKAPDRM